MLALPTSIPSGELPGTVCTFGGNWHLLEGADTLVGWGDRHLWGQLAPLGVVGTLGGGRRMS